MSSGRFGNSPDTVGSGGWLGRLARSRVRAVLLGVVVLAALALAPSAGAHLRSGTVAIDYRARVFDSSTSAYSAQIFQSDRALGVTLKPGHVVMLVGYLGEPVFRLDASGLSVNAASPTAVVDGLVKKSNRVLAATPRWRLGGRAPARVRGAGRAPRRVECSADRRWAAIARRRAAAFPWPLGTRGSAGGRRAPLLLRRRGLVRSAAAGFAVMASAASVLILIAFALDAYASPGTWIEAADAIALSVSGSGFCFADLSGGGLPARSAPVSWRWPLACSRLQCFFIRSFWRSCPLSRHGWRVSLRLARVWMPRRSERFSTPKQNCRERASRPSRKCRCPARRHRGWESERVAVSGTENRRYRSG